MSLDIYAEELIYHYEHPSSKRAMKDATVSLEEQNISCGDVVKVHLKLKGDKVDDASFEGNGCVIAMGSANMLMEHLKGKSIEHLEKMTKEDLLRIIKIEPGPVRLHCATLPLRAVKKAVLEYQHKQIDSATKEL